MASTLHASTTCTSQGLTARTNASAWVISSIARPPRLLCALRPVDPRSPGPAGIPQKYCTLGHAVASRGPYTGLDMPFRGAGPFSVTRSGPDALLGRAL